MDQDQMFTLAVTLAAGTPAPGSTMTKYGQITKHIVNCYATVVAAHKELFPEQKIEVKINR